MKEILLFGRAFTGIDASQKISFSEINKVAVQVGYLVHEDCCTKDVFEFLKMQPKDYNSTFYKSWNDVLSKNRFEIWIDQIISYIGTYVLGEQMIPNNVPNNDAPKFSDLKVIYPISREEVNGRCCEMLYSGIALKEETMKACIDLVYNIQPSLVKNKEAMMYLHKKFNSVPTDPVEFMRYLVFLGTGKTLLIKDRDTIFAMSNAKIDLASMAAQIGAEKLSSVFYRFKPLFLALKKNGNSEIVNRLRRLAKRNHAPMKIGFFEAILSDVSLLPELSDRLSSCSNFKKILLLQTINVRKKESDVQFFPIRNGKLWAKESKKNKPKYKSHLDLVYSMIYDSLITSLSKKKTSVCLPNDVNIALPTSEKSFIGNYPLGTSFALSDADNVFGIHWRESDGATDLDFSLTTIDGRKYGWNSDWKNNDNSIIYSGDMTRANPEAVELAFCKKNIVPSIVKVNMYNGTIGSKFKLFYANENIQNMKRGYMVDPNNIKFSIDCTMTSKEKMFGIVTGKEFMLAEFRTGNKIVSGDSISNKYIEYTIKTMDCYLSLEKVLRDAGYEIAESDAKIDLRNLQKDTLISMLS